MAAPVHTNKDLDLTFASRGVWLVKVPKYVANKWEKVPGNIEVGKLKIVKNPGQKAQVSLSLSEATMCVDPDVEKIPKEHRLDVQTVNRQTLGVFSHYTPTPNPDAIVPESEKLTLEGKIVQKLECRPYADSCYMKLKLDSFIKASEPVRQVKHLDKIVQNFKPVSDHKHNIEYNEKKKAEGKKARDDKESVLEMLFAAFEKHQYYNIKDLVKITKQPVVYLKEILKEVCNYNLKNPHKNMWELKPEYRCYKEEDDKKDAAKEDEDDD